MTETATMLAKPLSDDLREFLGHLVPIGATVNGVMLAPNEGQPPELRIESTLNGATIHTIYERKMTTAGPAQ